MKAALDRVALLGRVARRGDKDWKDVRVKRHDATITGSANRSPRPGTAALPHTKHASC